MPPPRFNYFVINQAALLMTIDNFNIFDQSFNHFINPTNRINRKAITDVANRSSLPAYIVLKQSMRIVCICYLIRNVNF